MNTMKTIRALKLLDKLKVAHDGSIFSLGEAERAGAGTATQKQRFARYEKRREEFDRLLTELRTLIGDNGDA